jgi:DNA polymerase III sliding clamp (beta) subunit (PCNA family)
VKIEEEGAIAVPGNILAGFLSQLTNEKSVLLEVKEGNLYVSSSKNSTIIKAFPVDDYPSIPMVDKDTSKRRKTITKLCTH